MATAVAVAILAIGLTGCIGATSQDEFAQDMQERSGGVSGLLVTRAIAALGDHLGTPKLSLGLLTVNGRARTVSMIVVDPRDTEKRDTYEFHDATLNDPEPVQVTRSTSLESDTFRVQEVPALADVGAMVDVTLDELAIEGGLVTSLTVRRNQPSGVVISLDVSTERAAGTATFDASGKLLEARRS